MCGIGMSAYRIVLYESEGESEGGRLKGRNVWYLLNINSLLYIV